MIDIYIIIKIQSIIPGTGVGFVESGGETSVTTSTPVDFGEPGKRREPSNDSLSYRLALWTAVFIHFFIYRFANYSFFVSMNLYLNLIVPLVLHTFQSMVSS